MVEIRRVYKTDIDKCAAPLSELGAATFTESFGDLYSPEDLAFFVNENHSEAAYRRDLKLVDHHVWIAQEQDQYLGYAMIKPNSLPCSLPDCNVIELCRIYVRKDHHGKSIGQKLIDAAFIGARQVGYNYMTLSVWSQNFGGHRFYRRNGFEKIGEYQFPVGEQLDDEWIMGRPL